MRPTLEILSADLIDRIVDEALQRLRDPGVDRRHGPPRR